MVDWVRLDRRGSDNGENARDGHSGTWRATRNEERDVPVRGPKEMRIRVEASGLCQSDVVTVQGLFPIVQYPHVPGHEVIGVVDAIGAGVHGWTVGARAGVGWVGGSCGYCRQCQAQRLSPGRRHASPSSAFAQPPITAS
jgi:D-arabinose 1-dehydrogenase-like Zn-dependent alcohol dehydrogenase